VFLLSGLECILQKELKNWPEFLPNITGKLQSDSPSVVYGSLLCLHTLVKSLRYMKKSKNANVPFFIFKDLVYF
jgi:hypothetical protein